MDIPLCVFPPPQGYFLLFESMLDSVLYARDMYLAEGGSGKSVFVYVILLAHHCAVRRNPGVRITLLR